MSPTSFWSMVLLMLVLAMRFSKGTTLSIVFVVMLVAEPLGIRGG